jgi:carboxypeptidase C (cathepsin A)
LYLFGVSYAGHYIPALGRAVFNELADLNLNYKGMGLGDPWNSPIHQVKRVTILKIGQYDTFLYAAGLIDDY